MTYYNEAGYLTLASAILRGAPERKGRTQEKYYSIFGPQLVFDNLNTQFPLLTTKRVPYRLVFEELMWFINGHTNVKPLQEKNVNIWNEWADSDGSLGRTYGAYWMEQLPGILHNLYNEPYSRRNMVVSWEANIEQKTNLPPCHMLYQFFVTNNAHLDMAVYQRSADWFLGVPFNIASYATLMYLVSYVCDLIPSRLIMNFGDAHIYENHRTQMQTQVERTILTPPWFKFVNNPKVHEDTLFTVLRDFKYEDIEIVDYIHHGDLKGDVAV